VLALLVSGKIQNEPNMLKLVTENLIWYPCRIIKHCKLGNL